jgi:hypothetical protein
MASLPIRVSVVHTNAHNRPMFHTSVVKFPSAANYHPLKSRPETAPLWISTLFSVSRAVGFACDGYDRRTFAGAPAQRFFQAGRAAVFFQQVVEGLVGEFLKRFHAFMREHLKFVPGLFVKLHAFANHGWTCMDGLAWMDLLIRSARRQEFVLCGFSLFSQLAQASFSELLPGLGHLLKLLPM